MNIADTGIVIEPFLVFALFVTSGHPSSTPPIGLVVFVQFSFENKSARKNFLVSWDTVFVYPLHYSFLEELAKFIQNTVSPATDLAILIFDNPIGVVACLINSVWFIVARKIGCEGVV